jgi:glycosyltransferase involved in cell wall biosynthesis
LDDVGLTAPVRSGAALLGDRSVALVHEWFGATGGSEKVFLHMGDLMPHADRFVLWRDSDAPDVGELRPSWLGRTPLRRSKALALPVMPLAWRTLTRDRYDVVLSSSHAFAHTVKLNPDARYLSYVHSPARYVWSPTTDGRGANPLWRGPRRVLQAADVRLSRHVHAYAANSREVRARIRRYWGRDAAVINPPVEVEYFANPPEADREQNRDYLLGVGRWVPYKRFDHMIAIAEAARLPLVIAGSGPEEARLRHLAAAATTPVTFLVRPDDAALRRLYWGARALLFPTHEDFGMIPVEAQACGTPVVGLARGGLLETVIDGETGHLTENDDYASLAHRVDALDPDRIRRHAATFSRDTFDTRLAAWLAAVT